MYLALIMDGPVAPLGLCCWYRMTLGTVLVLVMVAVDAA